MELGVAEGFGKVLSRPSGPDFNGLRDEARQQMGGDLPNAS
jgi:hypothetical protein